MQLRGANKYIEKAAANSNHDSQSKHTLQEVQTRQQLLAIIHNPHDRLKIARW